MKDKIITRQKIVVVFDICSSSNIIEDLTLTDNLKSFNAFLNAMDRFIRIGKSAQKYTCYKYLGDGWILLFQPSASGVDILNFLNTLCKFYKLKFNSIIKNHLENFPKVIGINFGIEKGKLVRTKLNNRIEWFGRAINIACRLQGAIKDNDTSPQYKALISNQVYHDYFKDIKNIKEYKPLRAKRTLRNIRENYICYKISFNKT